jgi:hypothetical protein
MAKILTTKGSSAALEDIIMKAEKEVYLISFSFIVSLSFQKIIRRAIDKGITIKIVYGKSIRFEDENSFKELPNIQINYLPNLHAKIFANENKCIIGSMNFSEVSEMNNTELGVLLTSSSDGKTFDEAIEHCRFILQEARIERPLLPKNIIKSITTPTEVKKASSKNEIINYSIMPGFNDPIFFHLPAMKQILSNRYPNDKIEFDEIIHIADFPKKGIRLEVSGRIDFVFDKNHNYPLIKEVNKEKLRSAIPNTRFYWNKPMINIYLESKWQDELTPMGNEKKCKRFLNIIESVAKNLEC